MRMAGAAVLAGAALSLAACAPVGPNYRGPPPSALVHQPTATGPFAGASERAVSTGPVPGEWWRLYRDPVLDGFVRQALVANTDLRAAAANLARSRAALQEAEAARTPATVIGAGAGYGRVPHAALPGFISYDAGLSVVYPFDVFGKLRRAIEATHADADTLQAAEDFTRITVAADTARAYADTCTSGHELAVARRVLTLQEESFSRTELLVRAGKSGTLDLARGRALVEQLRANVPPLEAQHRTALFRLATLIGKPPAEFPREVEACDAAPVLTSPLPVGDGAALLRRRPDVRQAERALAAATARVGVAVADLYPSVSLGLSGGSTGLASEFAQTATLRWNVGPLVSWTFPNTSAARARIAQSQAAAAAALAQLDGVVLRALRELESALTVYARDLDRTAALRAARDASAEAAREADLLYRAGKEGFLTVLDAERTLANSEAALAASESRLVADQVTLFLALGGGWEPASTPPAR